MKQFSLLMMTAILAFCTSCKKAPEAPKGSNKIVIGNTTADSTSYNKIAVSTQVTNLGGNSIQQHGHCWGTAVNPDINGNHSSLGSLSAPSTFSEQITSLNSNTKYYIRPYITYPYGTLYGQEIESATLQVSEPVITTGDITEIKYNSATVSATVTADGGYAITKRGVCWNTTGNPTLTNCIGSTDNGTGTGTFTTLMTNLSENTSYFVAGYATNSVSTAYGETKPFSTLQLTLPQVTTANVSNITATFATCGGNVTSDGNGTVSARGVCWNTTGSPTLSNSLGHTTDGTGTGTFTSNLTGLNNGTTYFVTAYATNEKGTVYSTDIKQFIAQNPPCGQMTVSYGGQTYNTVKIGTQCWFKENLNIGTRINGIQNQTNNSTIEKYCYNDQESNCDTYGGLYQWDELMQYVTTQGAKGICPDGWHIPTDAEWTTLTTYLGGESVAGGKMKEAGTAHWASPNTGATNSSGFTALPGGYRGTGGGFYGLAGNAYFWSSSQYGVTYTWSRVLYCGNEYVGRTNLIKTYGFSCRCLQD